MQDLEKRYSDLKNQHFENNEEIEKYLRLAIMVRHS